MTKKLVTGDEAEELMLLMSRFRYAVRMRREKECAEFGITSQQAAVIQVIHEVGGEAKETEISLWLSRRRHSVHSIIERMEKAGLVYKVRDNSRKNGVKILLSEKSKGLLKRIKKRDSARRVVSKLSTKNRIQLKVYLNTLCDAAWDELGVKDDLPLRPTPKTVD